VLCCEVSSANTGIKSGLSFSKRLIAPPPPKKRLELHLIVDYYTTHNCLARKTIGDNHVSTQAARTWKARAIIDRQHKLYPKVRAFDLRGKDECELHQRSIRRVNVLLGDRLN